MTAEIKSKFSKANQERRALAYSGMESDLRDLCRQAAIADFLFQHDADKDDDDGLGPFAVEQLDIMLRRFRDRYYEVDFGI